MSIYSLHYPPYSSKAWSYNLQRIILLFCTITAVLGVLLSSPTNDDYAHILSDQIQIEQATYHLDDVQEDGIDELLPAYNHVYAFSRLNLRPPPFVQRNLNEFIESIYAPPQ